MAAAVRTGGSGLALGRVRGQIGGLLLLLRAGEFLQNHQPNTGHIIATSVQQCLGALAKLRHVNVRVTAEFKTGRNQQTINFDADDTRKLEGDFSRVGAVHRSREYPSSAGDNGPCEEANRTLRVVGAECGERQVPVYFFIRMPHMS